jgi:hypothetical protein
MDDNPQGIHTFLRLVSKHPDLDTLVTTIQQEQRARNDVCLRASEFAAHLIVDLYDPASDDKANRDRIVLNLESAAHELLHYSKRINALR